MTMAPTQWERLAARLWPRERERPADPVDIEYAVMGALPVEIRLMDRPSIRDIEVWAAARLSVRLRRRDAPPARLPDRPPRGRSDHSR
ncbi:MAG: hypothetical protein U0531_08750 [Dehalococcoidia bacterium]